MNRNLRHAAQRGDAAEVARMIRAGANVNSRDTYGYTPLWFAVYYGHLPVVELLLVAPGIDVNQESARTTPLQTAIQRDNDEIALRLLAVPTIDVNKAPDGYAPILMAAMSDAKLPILEQILSKPDVNVNVKNIRGDASALCNAIRSKQYRTIERLLMHPAIDVNNTFDFGGGDFTPLMLAVDSPDERIVNLLLAHPKIDIHYTNSKGESAVSIATKGNEFSQGERKLIYKNILGILVPRILAGKAWDRRRAAVTAWAAAQAAEENQAGGVRSRKSRTHKRQHRKHQSRRRRM